MNDSAQSIITIIIVLVVIAIFLSPFIGLFGYIFYQNSKRRRIRERILASRRDVIGNYPWFPVRYAAQPRFDAFWKFFPWDTVGVVVMAPGSVLFLGESLSGTPITLQFTPGNSRLAWLGKCPWPNGAVSWFQFQAADGKHYFSSETGVLVFGSHASTKAIFDEANRNFGAPAAQNI